MIKAGVVGSTGYAGAELARILMNHPEAELTWYGSRSYEGQKYADIYRNFYQFEDAECRGDDLERMASENDVVFTATPQGYLGSKLNEDILEKTKVIDLSADYRIKDAARYEEWYGIHHETPGFLSEAVYGLPEIMREKIRKARLVANPGCFPTCSILAVYPLVEAGVIDPDTIIIDAKSGVTGAGRGAKVQNLYCEVTDSVKAYGVTTHRHTPEIEDILSIAAGRELAVQFTPHLVPMNRGILVTAYARAAKPVTEAEAREILVERYRDDYFVRVLPESIVPETRWVRGSNFADVAVKVDRRTGLVIMMGAIDNVGKGAAGQAVQNMNLLFGLEEKCGLTAVPYPF